MLHLFLLLPVTETQAPTTGSQPVPPEDDSSDDVAVKVTIAILVPVFLLALGGLLTWYCLKCWLPRRRLRVKKEAAISRLLGRLAQDYLRSDQKLIEAYADFMVKHDTQRRLLENDKLVSPLYSRYNNIQCLKSTVVRLPGQQDDDVFHANFVQMDDVEARFIACEAPTEERLETFYDIIFEHQVEVVIMLCRWLEGDKEKATPYFDDGGTIKVGQFQVSTSRTDQFMPKSSEYQQRELRITNKTGVQRKILHIHWETWEDMSVPRPDKFHVVTELIRLVDSFDHTKPVIVHCSAGVGRSGSFILAHAASHLLKNDPARLERLPQMVAELRQQRCQSVQNWIQLYFVAAYIVQLIKKEYGHADLHLCYLFLGRYVEVLEGQLIQNEGRRLGRRIVRSMMRHGALPPGGSSMMTTVSEGPLSVSRSRSRTTVRSKDCTLKSVGRRAEKSGEPPTAKSPDSKPTPISTTSSSKPTATIPSTEEKDKLALARTQAETQLGHVPPSKISPSAPNPGRRMKGKASLEMKTAEG